MKPKTIIGQAELVVLKQVTDQPVPARIDTGARTSAIWASSVAMVDGRLEVVFFGTGSPYYSGKVVYFDQYEQTVVASSNGHAEKRYKVRLVAKLGGRRINTRFTLADRSQQVYPVLIGRNMLRGKYVVDVSTGTRVLRATERDRSTALRQKMEER